MSKEQGKASLDEFEKLEKDMQDFIEMEKKRKEIDQAMQKTLIKIEEHKKALTAAKLANSAAPTGTVPPVAAAGATPAAATAAGARAAAPPPAGQGAAPTASAGAAAPPPAGQSLPTAPISGAAPANATNFILVERAGAAATPPAGQGVAPTANTRAAATPPTRQGAAPSASAGAAATPPTRQGAAPAASAGAAATPPTRQGVAPTASAGAPPPPPTRQGVAPAASAGAAPSTGQKVVNTANARDTSYAFSFIRPSEFDNPARAGAAPSTAQKLVNAANALAAFSAFSFIRPSEFDNAAHAGAAAAPPPGQNADNVTRPISRFSGLGNEDYRDGREKHDNSAGGKAPSRVGAGNGAGGSAPIVGGGNNTKDEREQDSEKDDEDDEDDFDEGEALEGDKGEEDEDKMETDNESEGVASFDDVLKKYVVKSFHEPDAQTGNWTCIEPINVDGVVMKCGHPIGAKEGTRLHAMRATHMKIAHNTITEAKAKEERKKSKKTNQTKRKPSKSTKSRHSAEEVPVSEDDLPEEDPTPTAKLRSKDTEIKRLKDALRKTESEKDDILDAVDSYFNDIAGVEQKLRGVSCVYCVHACCIFYMRLTYANRSACEVYAADFHPPPTPPQRSFSADRRSWQC